MKRDEAMKLVEEGIATLNEALRLGRSETMKRFLDTVARFHQYSLNNALLIATQKPDATNVAGFHTWRKLGRCVRKGERGIAIFAPMSRRKVGDERETTASDDQELVFGFRVVYVFDVTQTDGDSLPQFAEITGDASGWLPHLEEAVRESVPASSLLAVTYTSFVLVHSGFRSIGTPGTGTPRGSHNEGTFYPACCEFVAQQTCTGFGRMRLRV